MKDSLMKNLEKIIVGIISIFIVVGLFLNYQLRTSVGRNNEEMLYTDAEKEHFSNIFNNENRNGKVIHEEYLTYLEQVRSKYDSKEIDIAIIYYYLGFNAYLDNNYEDARKYIGSSMDIFEKTTNYFYILNGNNILMNLAYRQNDEVEGVNRANKIYEILQISNIEGMSEKGQTGIKVNVLNGLVNISSKLGMTDMAKTYYDELIEITKDKTFEDNIAIYAKYIYNFSIENYREAKKFAQEYVKYHEVVVPDDEDMIKNSHIYLLEVLMETRDFDGVREVFEKLSTSETFDENIKMQAMIAKLSGMANAKEGLYDEAFEYYKFALSKFEEVKDYENFIFVNDNIIKLAAELNTEVEPYIKNIEKYSETYDKDAMMGELADSLTQTAYQKNTEESAKIEEELKANEKITGISKKINIIYLVIIGLLVFMSKKLKNEILSRKSKEKELEKMVRTDYLTKAYSKQFIFDKTNEYVTHKKKFTFVLFDLDNFKKINDNYGHTFGDEVLVKMVRSIKEIIGKDGYIGRFGGEEFVILLKEGVDPSKLISDIRESIAGIEYSLAEVRPTVSGGAIRWDGHDADKIVYDADVLLYKAKAEGKDKILLR
ncbi:GGDEF domain-containing protein [uncultured Clostridium sp.]|jgi:diguanylate cyclase (GGDEF)-like protein|uniref:tetratricopeptide repeat-containing diguanylate cyclase n=1 Tax=uncultured Clostridium sp. TaxID=59620 RepID=UPI00260B351D|nr:GGDEF domain-containing protein [uncultured Clostridium sp.]